MEGAGGRERASEGAYCGSLLQRNLGKCLYCRGHQRDLQMACEMTCERITNTHTHTHIRGLCG